MKKIITSIGIFALCGSAVFAVPVINGTAVQSEAGKKTAEQQIAEKMDRFAQAIESASKKDTPSASSTYQAPARTPLEVETDRTAMLKLQLERKDLLKPDLSQYPTPTGYHKVTIGKEKVEKGYAIDKDGNNQVLDSSFKFVESVDAKGIVYKTGEGKFLQKPIVWVSKDVKNETEKRSVNEFTANSRSPQSSSAINRVPQMSPVPTTNSALPSMDQVLETYGVK